jgi:hypothetical protein
MPEHVVVDRNTEFNMLFCILLYFILFHYILFILNCVHLLYDFSRKSERYSAKPRLENNEFDLH